MEVFLKTMIRISYRDDRKHYESAMKMVAYFVVGALFGLGSFCFASDNSCVRCHENQKQTAELEHNYADWKKSVHAAKGVGCDACHGGNPNTSDPVKAHQGILSSRDKNSPVYFQKVPQTCGKCHASELAEFQKSVHYKILEDSGKGPSCLTCHGAMATTVLTHAQLNQTCSLCHGKPTQAVRALSLIHSLKNAIQTLRKKEGDSAAVKNFESRYRAIQKQWHSFDISGVTKKSQELLKEIQQAREGLKK